MLLNWDRSIISYSLSLLTRFFVSYNLSGSQIKSQIKRGKSTNRNAHFHLLSILRGYVGGLKMAFFPAKNCARLERKRLI